MWPILGRPLIFFLSGKDFKRIGKDGNDLETIGTLPYSSGPFSIAPLGDVGARFEVQVRATIAVVPTATTVAVVKPPPDTRTLHLATPDFVNASTQLWTELATLRRWSVDRCPR